MTATHVLLIEDDNGNVSGVPFDSIDAARYWEDAHELEIAGVVRGAVPIVEPAQVLVLDNGATFDAVASPATFNAQLDAFVALLDAKTAAHFARHYPASAVPTHTAERGQKYVRIVQATDARDRSVHCFVEIATGKIAKSASWKVPAKRAGGELQSKFTITELDRLAGLFDPHGAYLYAR